MKNEVRRKDVDVELSGDLPDGACLVGGGHDDRLVLPHHRLGWLPDVAAEDEGELVVFPGKALEFGVGSEGEQDEFVALRGEGGELAGDGIIEPYRGNFSFYLADRERRHEQRLKERKHQEGEIARLEAGIQRFKAKASMANTAK